MNSINSRTVVLNMLKANMKKTSVKCKPRLYLYDVLHLWRAYKDLSGKAFIVTLTNFYITPDTLHLRNTHASMQIWWRSL